MNSERMTRARTALVLDAPFYGQLALRLAMKADESCKTLSVDGKTIRYNPEFVETLDDELLKSAIGHEVLHCVFNHINRRGDRTPRRWNMAGDFVINAVLKDSGFRIGDGWLYDPLFAPMSSDEVYSHLPPDEDGDGGSGAGQPGGPLDEMVEGESSDIEGDEVDWKVAAVQAANAAKEFGKLPGSLERFVESITSPQVNWRDTLRQFVNEIAKDDYSWARPNRRFLSQGIFLPGLWSENMGEFVAVVDTSGSITQEMLNKFGGEIKAIVDTTRPTRTHVIYCDAGVNHVDTFEQNEVLKFEMHGGGGTDFRPPFNYVTEKGITPVCLVYLTDLEGPTGDAPDYPVMWACTTKNIGPWGSTIYLKD